MNPNIPAHMVDAAQAYPLGDDECMDKDGEVYPDHDFPPVGWGNECRRCGAEADDEDDQAYEAQEAAEKAEDDALDARLRDGVKQLLAATTGHEFPADYPQQLIAKAQADPTSPED